MNEMEKQNETPLTASMNKTKNISDVIRRLDERMKKGGCDPNKCRHFRSNLVLEGLLMGQYKCPEQSKFMEMHAAFL